MVSGWEAKAQTQTRGRYNLQNPIPSHLLPWSGPHLSKAPKLLYVYNQWPSIQNKTNEDNLDSNYVFFCDGNSEFDLR